MLGLVTYWNVQDVVSFIEVVNIGTETKIPLKLVFEKKLIMFGQGYVFVYFKSIQLLVIMN